MRPEELIAGYADWTGRYIEANWYVYFVTFQFNHLGENPRTATDLMWREIERFYATLLTNVVRNPNRASQLCNRPVLVGFPDRPVSKRTSNYRVSDTVPNSGIHVHSLVTIPPVSRLRHGLVVHVDQNMARYLGNHGNIVKIDVRPVTHTLDRLIDYMFKQLKRRTFSSDDILVLPRSISELPRSFS